MSYKITLKRDYPVLIIIALAVLINAPIWLGFIDFYSGDLSDTIPYFYGLKLFLYQSFQEFKEIPFWNPYIMFGQSVVGNLQYGLFYPLNFVFLLLSFSKALWISHAVHMIIAGLGAYLLARHTGCNKNTGMVAGCLYILNGRLLYYINAGWLDYFFSICWLPLFVLMSILVMEKKQRHYSLAFGVVFAMTFLSGTPQYAFMGFLLFLLQGAVFLFITRSKDERGTLMFSILLAGLISFLLISIQFFPALEQTFLSSRIFPRHFSMHFHFDWSVKQWLRILFRPEFLVHDFAWELSGYIGIGAMIMAIQGLFGSRKNLHLVIIWGLIPILVSLGPNLPLLDRGLKSIPGISMLSHPSRYYIFTILIMCILAGHGLERFWSFKSNHKKAVLFLITVGLFLVLSGIMVSPYNQASGMVNVRFFGATIVFFLLAALYLWQRRPFFRVLLIFWLILDPILVLSGIMKGYQFKDLQPPVKIIEAVKAYNGHTRIASIQPDYLWNYRLTPIPDWIGIQNRISRAGGYEALAMFRTLEYLNKMERTRPSVQTEWFYRLKAFSRPGLFDIAGITHLITAKPIKNPRLKFITVDTITMPDFCGGWWENQPLYLYENTKVLPRAFFVAENSKFSAVPIELKLICSDRRQLLFQTKQPGIVVVSESFHPGWMASEQKKAISLTPFLDTFISFYVPAGQHEVLLDFAPKSFYLGLQFTLIGLFLILLLLLMHKREVVSKQKGRLASKATPVIYSSKKDLDL